MTTQAVITDSPALARFQQRALIVGGIGLVASLIGAAMDFNQFIHSWLIGFLFCLGLTLGSLALLMLQHLSGGQWGLVSRRIFEAATRTLPLVALFFIPVALRLPDPLRVGAAGGGEQRHHPGEGRLPQSGLLHHPRGHLLRVLDAAGGAAQPLVGGTGPRPGDDASRQRALPYGERAGPPLPRADGDVRLGRLDHVARPGVVLDHLRPA